LTGLLSHKIIWSG